MRQHQDELKEIRNVLLSEYWRISPRIFRKALGAKFLSTFGKERFLAWTDKTNGAVRLFELLPDGSSKSGLVANQSCARDFYVRLKNSNAAFTFHMNDVELVDQAVFDLRNSLEIPFWWRIDDVIATLSSEGSGIGYHAGHEDGFIVQLAGSRRWRVWSDKCTPIDYRYELLAPSDGPTPKLLRPKCDENLLIDTTLVSGDILYIPPYYPHEGITLEDSVSLSIAWKGLGPASFIPKSFINSAEPSCKALFFKNSTKLFADKYSAEESIQNWLKLCLELLPLNLQNEFQSIINDRIESHFFKLFSRYCKT